MMNPTLNVVCDYLTFYFSMLKTVTVDVWWYLVSIHWESHEPLVESVSQSEPGFWTCRPIRPEVRGRKLVNLTKRNMNKTSKKSCFNLKKLVWPALKFQVYWNWKRLSWGNFVVGGCLTMKTITTPMIPRYLYLLFCFDWGPPSDMYYPHLK